MQVWFADSETLLRHHLWVMKNKRTKEIFVCHNDLNRLRAFFDSQEDLYLVGFNFRDYDQYMLKGALLGYTNEQLKELSDILVFGELQDAWDYLGDDAWNVELPGIIDIFHDMGGISLEHVQANMGRKIHPSEINFDTKEELTEKELELFIDYCIDDVETTEALYYERIPYVRAKKDLCDMVGLDDSRMMINSNARVTAEAMGAVKVDPFEKYGIEYYEDVAPWHIIRKDKLPNEVVEYVSAASTHTGVTEKFGKLLFDFFGTPTKLGIGGIHAATGVIDEHVLKSGPRKGQVEYKARSIPTYYETDDDSIVVLQDAGSFYPWIMILYDCLSRNIPEDLRDRYLGFLITRMEAKRKKVECNKKGDKKGAKHWENVAEAAKLVLNTLYGATKQQYSKLYDPFKATCVCLNGQLFVIDLVTRIKEEIEELEIVQLNTDGWMLKLPKNKYEILIRVTNDWCDLTGFTVDTDVIKRIWQRDVNNYVMEGMNGEITAKGGNASLWEGGDYESNSMSILDTALVKKLLYGTPIETTINECNDFGQFQVILKAGRTFNKCAKIKFKSNEERTEYMRGKIHRVYATTGDGYTYYKCNDDGRSDKYPDAPLCAFEDDQITLDNLDKNWYIRLAQKRYNSFIGVSDKKEGIK